MGARNPSRPAGLEARERFEAFQAARCDVEGAEQMLKAVLAAAAAAAPSEPAFAAGVELARRRMLHATARLQTALDRLADGRPPYEAAFWRLPDDL
jgi:hypothetical protein